MKNIYQTLSDKLLYEVEHESKNLITFNAFGKGYWFGLSYKRNYSGLMANPIPPKKVESEKEGLFDCLIHTGNRYLDRNNYKWVTHYNLFHDLLENSNWQNCVHIWIGDNPVNLSTNPAEQQALSALSLLMFEQELNWGNEAWQRYSNFSPSHKFPNQRPRDMILGFLRIVFYYKNVDIIPNWQTKHINNILTKTTPTFGTSYANFEPNLKFFFDDIVNSSEAEPLMVGEYLHKFRKVSSKFSNNPKYKPK